MVIKLLGAQQMASLGIAPYTQAVLQGHTWQSDGQSLWSVINTMGVSATDQNADAQVSYQEYDAVRAMLLTANPDLWDNAGNPIIVNQNANNSEAVQAAIASGAIAVLPSATPADLSTIVLGQSAPPPATKTSGIPPSDTPAIVTASGHVHGDVTTPVTGTLAVFPVTAADLPKVKDAVISGGGFVVGVVIVVGVLYLFGFNKLASIAKAA